MRRILRRLWRDERGVSLAIIALMMTTLVSMLALSLDLGLLYTARAEAQRAADAAALAGASAFLNYKEGDPAVVDDANARAAQYAAANPIRGMAGEVVDIVVSPNPPQSVVLTVRREAVQLWFARLLGIPTVTVSASARAGAARSESAGCVAPLAFEHDAIMADYQNWPGLRGPPTTIAHHNAEVPAGSAAFEYVWFDPRAGSGVPPSFPTAWVSEPDGCPSGLVDIGDDFADGAPPLPNEWVDDLADETTCSEIVEEGNGWNSSRIIKVMLYSQSNEIFEVEDFLLFCVESTDFSESEVVHGQFLAYAGGVGDDGTSELTLTLQLTH